MDVDSGLASGQVMATPTLFIDGIVHRGGYDPPTLLAALAASEAEVLSSGTSAGS
jgi:protein-disulfide isomerase